MDCEDSPAQSVLIIGGGVSGLFTALKLAENGHKNVTVLESYSQSYSHKLTSQADDHFGGRVRSVPFKNGIIELGAQWIHGRGECPLWKFVTDNQIAVSTDEGGDGDGQFYLPGGHLMPKDVLEECQEFSENVHWHLNKFYHDKPLDQLPRSVGHFFQEQIRAFLAAEKDAVKLRLKTGFCDWFIKWELVDTGVDNLNNQSVRSWIDYIDYDLEGEEGEPVLSGGYSSLVTFLLASLEDRVVLRSGCSVVGIDWSGEEEVRVRTEAGESYSAQYLVISLPLGVLKSTHSSLFSPSLPKEKIEIIEQLHFGVMNKIFLSFDEIFWDQDNPGIQFIKTDQEEAGEREICQTWHESIAGFDSVCGQPSLLCGWISGPPAVYMESLSDREILETCWSLLKHYVGDWVPSPTSCTPTRWSTNPRAQGSYSYASPECERRQIGAEDLAATITSQAGKPRLFFCGEATEREHYGTVTGAMLSGCREGLKLARILHN